MNGSPTCSSDAGQRLELLGQHRRVDDEALVTGRTIVHVVCQYRRRRDEDVLVDRDDAHAARHSAEQLGRLEQVLDLGRRLPWLESSVSLCG